MTNTFAQGVALMKSSLERLHGSSSWHNWCASWVCRFVTGAAADGSGLGASCDTAWDAYAASGPLLSTDHANAPRGAIGWYRTVGGPGPGHVVVHCGKDQVAMASNGVPAAQQWGEDSGQCSWEHYHAAKPGMVYVGWTYDFVGQVIRDAEVVVKLPGDPALYLLTSATTRHHLTAAEWKALKAKGVPCNTITARALAHYALVS